MTAAALTLIWSSGSLAAENPTPLELLQEQETVLGELESAQGALHPDLVTPLQAMVDLLREQSEFERAAELQEQMLEVMQANAGEQSPDWIPSLREMVADQANSSAADGVDDLLRSLRILNAAKGDLPELIHTIELEAHWLMTGAAGISHEQRIRSFMRAQEILTTRHAYLIGELFDRNDPQTIPWLYQVARNNYQMFALLDYDSRTLELISRDLESRSPFPSQYRIKVDYLNLIQEIGEYFSAADDLEGQAMAKLYEADLALLVSRTKSFEMYGEARIMLAEAGVPDERAALYFSRPQLIPNSHFYPTLEEAITNQEADLATWRPEESDVAHVGTFTAWNDTSPILAAPVSDYVFWDPSSSYYKAVLSLNISSSGRASAVDILDFVPENKELQRTVRRAIRSLRFRPVIVNGKGQRLRDVQMRVLIPRTED